MLRKLLWEFALALFCVLLCTCQRCSSFLLPCRPLHFCRPHFANPVSEETNKLSDFRPEEAFLWFDQALLTVRAGSGGIGASSVKFGANRQHLGPSGGSGGKGGDVVLLATKEINNLLEFRGVSQFRAENGQNGAPNFANGRSGQNLIIRVPSGVDIFDNATDSLMATLMDGDQMVVAKGGLGGQGNAAALRKVQGKKASVSPPESGEKRAIRLELQLIADIGLVGFPNAGKSTLLKSITSANPKIAPYPFTTIIPNLGVCLLKNDKFINPRHFNSSLDFAEGFVIADLPGMLEGAHQGYGLGRHFLRHIERCKIILHLINGEGEDPVQDYVTINNELCLYSNSLASKPQIVVINKMDNPVVQAKLPQLLNDLRTKVPHSRILSISAKCGINIEDLVTKMFGFFKKVSQGVVPTFNLKK